jgi:hypothetical protein
MQFNSHNGPAAGTGCAASRLVGGAGKGFARTRLIPPGVCGVTVAAPVRPAAEEFLIGERDWIIATA